MKFGVPLVGSADSVVYFWLREKGTGRPFTPEYWSQLETWTGTMSLAPAAAAMPTTSDETDLCPRSARAGWSSLEALLNSGSFVE